MKVSSFTKFIHWVDDKRTSVREESLTMLEGFLTLTPHHRDFEKNYVSVYSNCLKRLTDAKKKSFSKVEVCLAIRGVSLICINLVNEEEMVEVYAESLPVLTAALQRFDRFDVEAVEEVIRCLGIVVFFGSKSCVEKEDAMMVVWKFIVDASGDDGLKVPSSVLSAAIMTWSFLLSSVDRFEVSCSHWGYCISYLAKLLGKENNEDEYKDVMCAATDALALIFKTNILEKFSQAEESEDYSLLKEDVLRKIHDHANLARVIQMKNFKSLMGEKGFATHLAQNENFRTLFKSESKKVPSGSKDKTTRSVSKVPSGSKDKTTRSVSKRVPSGSKGKTTGNPEREDLIVRFYQPKPETKHDRDDLLTFVSAKEKTVAKRMLKSPSSSLNKARSQLLDKQRQLRNTLLHEGEYENLLIL